MARFIKRKRGPNPNKNEEKVRRTMDADRQARFSGSVGDRYPQIESVSIITAFLSAQGQILDQQKRRLVSKDICNFSFACSGRCGKAVFNLTKYIEEMLASGQTKREQSDKCAEILYMQGPCGCEMRWQVAIDYAPIPEPSEEFSEEQTS